jgi:hypothetical protein
MKKLLLGTAIALTLTTASYAQTADYTYSWAHETYDSVKNAPCRTPYVDSAIFSLRNDIRSMDDQIAQLDNLLQSISASDPEPLREAAAKSSMQLNRAKFERGMMQAWLDNLNSKKECPPPAPPPVSVIPQPQIDTPPISQPAGTDCPLPHGRLRPILVATDPSGFMGVIWMDEQGNQYAATYNADGTSTWDGGGAAPARPSAEELSKAGSLSSGGIFREYQERLPKKACRELLPQQPESPEKVQKVELHREINWLQPPVIDEWRVRPHGRSEKSGSDSTRDDEKSDAKPSGNTDHSNGTSANNRARANARTENGSEHTARTVTHEAEEFHQVAHMGNGPVSGMHEGAIREGAVLTGGLAGTHAGGLIGTHLGGPGGVHMGGFGGMRVGGFGRF